MRTIGSDVIENVVPIRQLWIVKGFIVGLLRNDHQFCLGTAKRGQFPSHPYWKCAIALAMDDQNWNGTVRKRLVCRPYGWQDAGKCSRQAQNTGRVSKRSESRAKDQMGGRNPIKDRARDSAAH